MRLKADTQEAYEAAVESLGLLRMGTIGPITRDKDAYEYDYASRSIGSLTVTLESPRRLFKMVPADA